MEYKMFHGYFQTFSSLLKLRFQPGLLLKYVLYNLGRFFMIFWVYYSFKCIQQESILKKSYFWNGYWTLYMVKKTDIELLNFVFFFKFRISSVCSFFQPCKMISSNQHPLFFLQRGQKRTIESESEKKHNYSIFL